MLGVTSGTPLAHEICVQAMRQCNSGDRCTRLIAVGQNLCLELCAVTSARCRSGVHSCPLNDFDGRHPRAAIAVKQGGMTGRSRSTASSRFESRPNSTSSLWPKRRQAARSSERACATCCKSRSAPTSRTPTWAVPAGARTDPQVHRAAARGHRKEGSRRAGKRFRVTLAIWSPQAYRNRFVKGLLAHLMLNSPRPRRWRMAKALQLHSVGRRTSRCPRARRRLAR